MIPEKPLTFSPMLAATIGLEESILLQLLQECRAHTESVPGNGVNWHSIRGSRLIALAPFWREEDFRRLITSLHEKGLLLVSSSLFSATTDLRFAFDDQREAQREIPVRAVQPHSATTISGNWQPGNESLRQLEQLGVSRQFALQQVAQFVAYWRERNVPRHSWESKFINEVWRQWQRNESRRQERNKSTPIDENWRPSPEAANILTRQGGINANFVEDAIAEFVLYWRERGEESSTWDSKFIRHVRQQWHYFKGMMEQDNIPQPISDEWQPREMVYDILQMVNIEREFAARLVPEFVLYWRENGMPQASWSSKFLQYAKQQWAMKNRPAMAESVNAKQQGPDRKNRIRGNSIFDDLNDRSWATR